MTGTSSMELEVKAAEALRALAGPDAAWREHQLEAIRDLVEDRARVLCVQRTGWGKSAVYFVATRLLRDAGSGPTLIVSPLLALMRNQLEAAARLGLRAATINSTNRGEWREVEDRLAADDVDLLLVSPERLNHPGFRSEVLPGIVRRLGLLVVDEAHCVSDWGHDFRPDYRRLRDVVAGLPSGVAVLATTATANDRVVEDVSAQLAVGAAADADGGGAGLRTYRGGLGRASLRLEVVDGVAEPAARLAWLAEWVPRFEGSGIVYTLTVRDTEQVASWLVSQGVSAVAYSGQGEPGAREEAERRLLANDVKALVATSALGMGYDKPDLAWVVHFGAPGSVIAYYQQVGRAGRALDTADVVLLRGAEDRDVQDFFITQAFPSEEHVGRVLSALRAAGEEGMSLPELTGVVNLGRGRLDAMLKVLDVEGAVRRSGSRFLVARGAADWTYDGERYAAVTELRRAEQEAMARYGTDGRCLMRTLQEELDDPEPGDCGRCAVCAGPRFDGPVDSELVEAGRRWLRRAPVRFDAKKMAPKDDGRMSRIPEEARTLDGLALARVGDGGWWPEVQRALAGDADAVASVGEALAERVEGTGRRVRWVAAVPSRRRASSLRAVADTLAGALGVPVVEALERVDDGRPPQAEMRNAATQAANVRGAFRVVASPDELAGVGVLLDDERQSGWTLAMTGGQLLKRGAGGVLPVALVSSLG